MNFRKYLICGMLFLIVIISLSTTNAFTIQKIDKTSVTYSNGNSVITNTILSGNMVNEYKMKKDLNQINKVVIKLNGKTIDKLNRGKTWVGNPNYYSAAIISRKVVKGNVVGKKLSVLTYNDKNKLIKSRTSTIKSINIVNTIISKSEATHIAKDYYLKYNPNNTYIKANNARFTSKYSLWYVDFIDTRNNKKIGYTIVDDIDGKIGIV